MRGWRWLAWFIPLLAIVSVVAFNIPEILTRRVVFMLWNATGKKTKIRTWTPSRPSPIRISMDPDSEEDHGIRYMVGHEEEPFLISAECEGQTATASFTFLELKRLNGVGNIKIDLKGEKLRIHTQRYEP